MPETEAIETTETTETAETTAPVSYTDADGKFTDTFRTGLHDMLGDEHRNNKHGEPTKALDDMPDLQTLLRSHISLKKSFEAKSDGVINKPKEDASDEDKAAYNTGLRKELGFTGEVDGYKFNRI